MNSSRSTLDQGPDQEVGNHISFESKGPWETVDSARSKHQSYPPEMQSLWQTMVREKQQGLSWWVLSMRKQKTLPLLSPSYSVLSLV